MNVDAAGGEKFHNAVEDDGRPSPPISVRAGCDVVRRGDALHHASDHPRGPSTGVIDANRNSSNSAATRFLAGHRQQWGTGTTLSVAALATILVTASAAMFMNLQGRLSGIASETIARRLRDRLAAHIQHLPMSWHDKVQTGDIVQRCTSDVDTVRLFYREQVIEIARADVADRNRIPRSFMAGLEDGAGGDPR